MDDLEILQLDADESRYELDDDAPDRDEGDDAAGDDGSEAEDPYGAVDILVRQAERWDDERSYRRATEAIRELPEQDPMARLRKASIMHAFAGRKMDASLLDEARSLYEDVARSPELARPFRDLASQFAAEADKEEREARDGRRR